MAAERHWFFTLPLWYLIYLGIIVFPQIIFSLFPLSNQTIDLKYFRWKECYNPVKKSCHHGTWWMLLWHLSIDLLAWFMFSFMHSLSNLYLCFHGEDAKGVASKIWRLRPGAHLDSVKDLPRFFTPAAARALPPELGRCHASTLDLCNLESLPIL